MKYSYGYKLVDENYKTNTDFENETVWEIGKVYTIEGNKKLQLGTNTCFHYYKDLLVAFIMNRKHANIKKYKVIKVQVFGEIVTDGLIFGCTKMKPIKEINMPNYKITTVVAFGILCAEIVITEKQNKKFSVWKSWANEWLNNKNRSKATAYDVYAAYAVAADTADATAYAAYAIYAAAAAYAADVANIAVYTSYAAYTADIAASSSTTASIKKLFLCANKAQKIRR